MKMHGEKAKEAGERILAAFQNPAGLPAALAPAFFRFPDFTPHMRGWSWANQFLAALAGAVDARGFRQWEAVGRRVRKGAKAFYILSPCMVKVTDKDTGESEMRCVGFRGTPVFRYQDTEGEPLAGLSEIEAERERISREHIAGLPFREVAEKWGLTVLATPSRGCLGYYSPGRGEIGLAVSNLSTWAHELIHAADKQVRGTLKGGQDVDQEIVAELGGAVLLTLAGEETEADLGGCLRYIRSYAGEGKELAACQRLLGRVCAAVAAVLAAAENPGAIEAAPELVEA